MAKISLTLTEEHIKLIRCLRFEKKTDNIYGIDNYSLWGGTFIYEQMAYILGYGDKVIKGTEEDVDGPKYPADLIEKFNELDSFIVENIVNIEDLLHQRCNMGGILPGVKYVAYDHEGIWYTEDEWKNMRRR
ncbi:MAG: hypothetical protein J6Y37_07545 [Paludibacteraceae bacterium]|nr:hypothetical protein [Paludibacteraceae bacterium]